METTIKQKGVVTKKIAWLIYSILFFPPIGFFYGVLYTNSFVMISFSGVLTIAIIATLFIFTPKEVLPRSVVARIFDIFLLVGFSLGGLAWGWDAFRAYVYPVPAPISGLIMLFGFLVLYMTSLIIGVRIITTRYM